MNRVIFGKTTSDKSPKNVKNKKLKILVLSDIYGCMAMKKVVKYWLFHFFGIFKQFMTKPPVENLTHTPFESKKIPSHSVFLSW